MNDLTVAQLKERLAARGLSTEGLHSALKTRLVDSLMREVSQELSQGGTDL
jgi:hypothetical protein